MSPTQASVARSAERLRRDSDPEHGLSVVSGARPQLLRRDPLQESLSQALTNLLRYQELFDSAPIGYVVTDDQAIIQEANRAAAELFGHDKRFLVDKPLLFFVASSDRPAFLRSLLRLRRGEVNCVQCELTLAAPRARQRHVLATASASASRNNESVAIRWALRDISERWEYEKTLWAEKQFTDGLIELAAAVVLVLDEENRIVRTNDYTAALVGATPREMAGRTIEQLQQQFQFSGEDELKDFDADSGRGQGVHRLLPPDGSARMLAWTSRTFQNDDGGRSWTLVVGSDITELHAAQQRAAQAERLAQIGQAMASVSHESGNALQRINVSLELLRLRLADQPENIQLLEMLGRANDDLQRLQERVRAYAGPIRLEQRICDLTSIWREAWNDLQHLRTERRAELREEIPPADSRCHISPFHLKQVFRNLLENSLSSVTGPAVVTIHCATAELDGREAVEVTIGDNGPGFGPEERQKAFEPFYTTKTKGTGLGLPLCKRIVEAHGGRIELGEHNGPGGVVIITLPRFG
jgi:PAS domain S-box-containing protein